MLYNQDGTEQNFVTWEAEGPAFNTGGGATNGGAGNVDFPNIAVGITETAEPTASGTDSSPGCSPIAEIISCKAKST